MIHSFTNFTGRLNLIAVNFRNQISRSIFVAFALLLCLSAVTVHAQKTDAFGDPLPDPNKFFNQAQDAHARGDFKTALEFYQRALEVRPAFPEAEYQKAAALIALNRLPEAKESLRRAINLRADWTLPIVALARLDKRTGELPEAVELLKRATSIDKDTAALWAERAETEYKSGDTKSAQESLNAALKLNPKDTNALIIRAALRAAAKDFNAAIEDIKTARAQTNPTDENFYALTLQLARLYAMAGKPDAAARTLDEMKPAPPRFAAEAKELRDKLALAEMSDPTKERDALESLIVREPKNALALARLGTLTRLSDPPKSLEYFRRALDIEPRNGDYATGYAAALVQARRFADATVVLQRIIAVAPDNYAAHANLATALDELKDFKAALAEYEWINKARPDLAVTYFLIGRAHDKLFEFEDALAAYETFLSRADASQNKLEIERVNLRLPSLRNQIKHGEGVKKNKSKRA